jgi:hypothetical protein
MCGSKTTTKVETGKLSERGESYDSLYWSLVQQNMKDNGYTMSSKQVTKYSDEGAASRLQGQIADLDKKISAAGDSDPNVGYLRNQRDRLQKDLDKMDKVTYDDWSVEKMPDIRLQNAIDKYGENSPQANTIRSQLREEEVFKAEALAGTEKAWLQNLNKYVKGDYSYTSEQYNQLNKFIAPVREVIIKTTDDLISRYWEDDAMLRESLNDVSYQIDQTGYAVNDALQAASIQMDKSGATLLDVLKNVNNSNREKAKFEFDLLSEKADQQAAQQAAMLGLPPGSMAERVASQKTKADALKGIELNLAAAEASGALNIQSGVEQGKKEISLARVGFEQTQGAKREGVAKQGVGLTQLLTNKLDQAVGAKGNALINLEQQFQDMLYGAAYGNLPGQIQAGQQGLAFETAQKAAKQQMQNQMLAPFAQQLGVEQQRTFAETTTTQETKKGFLDAFTDILGAGASLAGSIYGMAGGGGGGKSSSSSGGGGGGAPATFMPRIDNSIYSAQYAPQFTLDWRS